MIVLDTDNNPPTSKMFENMDRNIPESLNYLLQQIIQAYLELVMTVVRH